MDNKRSFEELMTELTPTFQELEEKRRTLKQDAIRKSVLYSGIILVIALVCSLIMSDSLGGGLFGFIIIIPCCAAVFGSRSKTLCSYYKDQVISRFVETLVENGVYEPNTGISEQTFNESKLFRTPDRYGSEDYISGKIGKTPFCFAEAHAEEKHTRTDSKGRTTTTWETLFKGFLFIADFNKDFSGRTIISRHSFFNWGSDRVKLENPEFERKFDVYSSDQVEARYLLSPSMMERIIALDNKFGGDIVISFFRSNVFIAISNSRNHFEASLWRKVSHTDTLLEEYHTILALTAIVEDLNLNTRIWTKE